MLTQYYEDNDVTVSWDSINNWISVAWRNTPSKESVKKGCEEIRKLLLLKKTSLVLNDNTQINGAWGASSWVAEEWFPLMISEGLRKFAWIESPASALSVISAKRSYMKNNEGVISLFKDKAEAEMWLKS
ncbi:MAG: hypothetical protein HYS23_12805 [Geobacter sp.]|nr:hypothetical protein [Geobacter sp.]